MWRSRVILEEIRDLGRQSRDIHSEIRALREETAELRQQWLDEGRLNREVMRRNEIAFRDGSKLVSDALHALREESRAHTEAIFALIDRLGEGGAAAT